MDSCQTDSEIPVKHLARSIGAGVAKVDAQRGFMLYSVGTNRVDDGGIQRDGWGAQGDLVLLGFLDPRKGVARAKWLR